MKRVLAVDDSAFARKLIREILNASGQLSVVDTATNGAEALSKLDRVCPDVITLDVEMPVMDGLETLARIMKERPTPVVMISSLTTEGAEVSMAALKLGAIDVAAKPIAHGLPQLRDIADELVSKVLTAASVDVGRLARRLDQPSVPTAAVRRGSSTGAALPVVLIASSTGGPSTLRNLSPRLPNKHGTFYFLVQHLPVGFTAVMARELNTMTPLDVR
jgi:two-component system chemotaxis response regulator CheB